MSSVVSVSTNREKLALRSRVLWFVQVSLSVVHHFKCGVVRETQLDLQFAVDGWWLQQDDDSSKASMSKHEAWKEMETPLEQISLERSELQAELENIGAIDHGR